MNEIAKELGKISSHKIKKSELTLAFVEKSHIKKLNKQFRGKNKPTDILSFDGFEPGELGELVLCGDIVDLQAKEHKLGKNEELGYLLIHGVLHLLGYEHEKGGAEEKKMFALQDQIFDILRKRHF
ncbi:MAG: rRNA maturation RNase YbeY [Bdellovibrionales bacterium]|nr:rRNA maturation RNase YbeY [Bdellovibrionales bacterium]